MINALIITTVSASVVYFAIALVACLHDCLMLKFSNVGNVQHLPEPQDVSDSEHLVIAPALPTSIRGLRDYIRSNNLQARVKGRIGKTVSKCTKDELMAAIA